MCVRGLCINVYICMCMCIYVIRSLMSFWPSTIIQSTEITVRDSGEHSVRQLKRIRCHEIRWHTKKVWRCRRYKVLISQEIHDYTTLVSVHGVKTEGGSRPLSSTKVLLNLHVYLYERLMEIHRFFKHSYLQRQNTIFVTVYI